MVWILGSAEEPVLTATLGPALVLLLVVVDHGGPPKQADC